MEKWENCQNNSNLQTRQRRNTRQILQAHSIITLLSPIAKTLEKIIIPCIKNNIIIPPYQHGFKRKQSTTTALHKINNIISNGSNKKRTVAIALGLSKAFDTVNLHTLIHKLHNHSINTHKPTHSTTSPAIPTRNV